MIHHTTQEIQDMNMQHTPGPWTAMPHAQCGPEAKRFQVRGPDEAGPTAAFVCENARFANARLIAAAPELLALLQRGSDAISALEADCDRAGIDCQEARWWWQDADKIIAKAEGRGE